MSDNNQRPTGKHTLVEEGTEFTGKMSSSCPIVVMGKVEGEVAGPSVHVTASGVVAGTVRVKDLRSEGELAGDVEAESVRLSGRVRDKTVVRARSLEVSLNTTKGGMQVQFGECELAVGDAPSKEAAVTTAVVAPAPAIVGEQVVAVATEPTPRPEIGRSSGNDDHAKRKRGTQPPPV